MSEFLPLLDRALAEEIGILVLTNQPEALKALIYKTRRTLRDPKYASLTIFTPPSGDKIFIAKKSVELEA